MKKEITPEIRCESCNHIVEYKKEVQICDLKSCGKELDWDNKSGYPFTLDPIYHTDNLHSQEYHFCRFEHGLQWIKSNNPLTSHPDDFVSMYIHSTEWKILQRLITLGDKGNE